MKHVCLGFIGAMAVVALGALFFAYQFPYRSEANLTETATSLMVKCGAGYYNEGYLALAFIAVVAAGMGAVVMSDGLRS